MTIWELVGNVGVALYVASYFLVQVSKLSGDSLAYTLMNMLAACLVLVNLVFGDWNLPSALIQIFWIAASFVGVAMWSHKRYRAPSGGGA